MLIDSSKFLRDQANNLDLDKKQVAVQETSSDKIMEGSSDEESSSFEPVKMVLRRKNIAKQVKISAIQAHKIKKRKQRMPYSQVDSELRRKLLQMVEQKGYIIKEAATALNINYSTAKTILQLYKKTGRIDKIDQAINSSPHAIHRNQNEENSLGSINIQQDSGQVNHPSGIGKLAQQKDDLERSTTIKSFVLVKPIPKTLQNYSQGDMLKRYSNSSTSCSTQPTQLNNQLLNTASNNLFNSRVTKGLQDESSSNNYFMPPCDLVNLGAHLRDSKLGQFQGLNSQSQTSFENFKISGLEKNNTSQLFVPNLPIQISLPKLSQNFQIDEPQILNKPSPPYFEMQNQNSYLQSQQLYQPMQQSTQNQSLQNKVQGTGQEQLLKQIISNQQQLELKQSQLWNLLLNSKQPQNSIQNNFSRSGYQLSRGNNFYQFQSNIGGQNMIFNSQPIQSNFLRANTLNQLQSPYQISQNFNNNLEHSNRLNQGLYSAMVKGNQEDFAAFNPFANLSKS